ncbi:MAG: stage II sporulation protein M [Planctomycetota bacterium]
MNFSRFIEKNQKYWRHLEVLLSEAYERGIDRLERKRVGELLFLYRKTSADLNYAQSYFANATLLEYLHGLVGRSYALIYGKRRRRILSALSDFYLGELPVLVRKRYRYVLFATAIFVAGWIFGAVTTAIDPVASEYIMPEVFASQDSPSERVHKIYENGGTEGVESAGTAAFFSSFLFTHNIKICIFYFALGITFGIGTAILIFYNGTVIGSIMMLYLTDGEIVFFLAWILPHGVIELVCLLISGGGGFIIARGMMFRGNVTLRESMRANGLEALKILFAAITFLVLAGLVEGSISQLHPPLLPYWIKILFAIVLFSAFMYYLFLYRSPALRDRQAKPAEVI